TKAKAAQKQIEFWDQEKVDEMVAAVGWACYKSAEACAKLAYEETGMGTYEDKLVKHQKKTLGTLRDLHGLKTTGLIEEDEEKGLLKFAKPVGVIGALTPVTNASATLPGNALAILKTRNAVIFAPHPRAKKTCQLNVDVMRKALKQVGAPQDLVQCIEEPSIALTQQLMEAVDLVLATGGAGMVKAAYSSGTPAYGVGAGNSVCIVDDTADLEDAAVKIFKSKTFDYATSCSTENSVVIFENVFDDMLAELQKTGGYLCVGRERDKLEKALWPNGKHLNKDIIAQSAQKIADVAGIDLPEGKSFLMVMGEAVGPEDLFSGEKLSVVMTLWKVKDVDEAIQYVQDITGYVGPGHSCGIHTKDESRIHQLGETARVSRIMVNQPQCYGNSGNYDNGMPFTLTLGCGSWGNNITTENIHWKHFLNITWVAKPIEPVVPDEEVLFRAHWAKYGKE
ncbi:MAG: aldehyde dehydrogenase family protein, partial [Chloroflexota bacterium]|nr:aldehyde dehydrogenase family protein [Chloroflexota bacterium]